MFYDVYHMYVPVAHLNQIKEECRTASERGVRADGLLLGVWDKERRDIVTSQIVPCPLSRLDFFSLFFNAIKNIKRHAEIEEIIWEHEGRLQRGGQTPAQVFYMATSGRLGRPNRLYFARGIATANLIYSLQEDGFAALNPCGERVLIHEIGGVAGQNVAG